MVLQTTAEFNNNPLPQIGRSARSVVHPCMFEGKPTLFYEKGLAKTDPQQFRLQKTFAKENGFQLLEERREARAETEFDRRRATLPMLVLGASIASALPLQLEAHELSGSRSQVASLDVGKILENDSQIVHQLLAWIRAQDISVANLMQSPAVKRSTQTDMLKLAFGENMPASMNASELKVYGLYNFKNETVYLLDEINLSTIRGRAVLVHELVHYAQYRDGVNNRVRCVNELETLAYELEARYLKQHSMEPEFTAKDVHQLSACS